MLYGVRRCRLTIYPADYNCVGRCPAHLPVLALKLAVLHCHAAATIANDVVMICMLCLSCVAAGLWYILLITIALCFFLTLLHNARKDPKSKVGKALRRVGILKEPPETSPSMANSTGEAVLGSMPGGMNHSFTSVMSSMPGHSGQGAAIDGKRTLKMFLGVQTFAYK